MLAISGMLLPLHLYHKGMRRVRGGGGDGDGGGSGEEVEKQRVVLTLDMLLALE